VRAEGEEEKGEEWRGLEELEVIPKETPEVEVEVEEA
jgi:hypothetical protein